MEFSKFSNQLAILVSLLALLAAGMAFAGDAEKGKIAYTTNCLSCHGETGKGDGPVGAVLQPPPRDLSAGDFAFDTDEDGTAGTDADLKAVITKGAGAFGGNMMMAPWAGILSADDIDNVVAYIRTLK